MENATNWGRFHVLYSCACFVNYGLWFYIHGLFLFAGDVPLYPTLITTWHGVCCRFSRVVDFIDVYKDSINSVEIDLVYISHDRDIFRYDVIIESPLGTNKSKSQPNRFDNEIFAEGTPFVNLWQQSTEDGWKVGTPLATVPLRRSAGTSAQVPKKQVRAADRKGHGRIRSYETARHGLRSSLLVHRSTVRRLSKTERKLPVRPQGGRKAHCRHPARRDCFFRDVSARKPWIYGARNVAFSCTNTSSRTRNARFTFGGGIWACFTFRGGSARGTVNQRARWSRDRVPSRPEWPARRTDRRRRRYSGGCAPELRTPAAGCRSNIRSSQRAAARARVRDRVRAWAAGVREVPVRVRSSATGSSLISDNNERLVHPAGCTGNEGGFVVRRMRLERQSAFQSDAATCAIINLWCTWIYTKLNRIISSARRRLFQLACDLTTLFKWI